MFTVVGVVKRPLKGGQYDYYTCKCDCGNLRQVTKYHLMKGNSTSCGCTNRANHSLSPGEATLNEKFMICKNTAKVRKFDFSLTKEEYKSIVTATCHYCGEKPAAYNRYIKKNGSRNKGALSNKITQVAIDRAWVYINTVDRMDSKAGYFLQNCVPACWPCNEMKMDSTYESFIAKAYKIVAFNENKKNKDAE